MSIATAIQNAQQRVANAYTAVDDKGGTLPATQNLTNLPEAIRSIPSGGGGGGQTVNAKAAAGTESYTTNDKVILIPTTDLYDESVTSYGTDVTSLSGLYQDVAGFGYLDYKNGVNALLMPYQGSSASSSWKQVIAKWNSSYTAFDNPETKTVSVTYPFYDVYYANGYTWALRSQGLSYSTPLFNSLGIMNSEGVFEPLYTWSDAWTGDQSPGYGGDAVGKFFKASARNLSAYIYYINDSGTITSVSTGVRNAFPSKFNGTWYIVKGNSNGVVYLSDPSTAAFSCTGFGTYTDWWCTRFFDDNVDYLWDYDGTWHFKKVNKATTGWSIVELPDVAAAYFGSLQYGYLGPYYTSGHGAWRMRSKDHGDKVESFLVGAVFGYDSSGTGNKVAHFMFDKATETVERLPDVFLDIPDTYTRCEDLQVNWDLGLIGVTVSYVNSPDTTHHCALYVKKLDDMAGIYKYYAFPNQNQYYLNNSLTGFVTQNEGTDMFDNTVLEVSTVEDPTAPPWSNVGKVFGMTISVNKGNI